MIKTDRGRVSAPANLERAMTKKSKSIKHKFPQTKELVRIALNDGMTQSEIARMCRTQQSQVSKWKSGERLATRDQVRELVKLYGDKLRRVPFKLYQTRGNPGEFEQFARVEGKLILREKFLARFDPQENSHGNVSALRISVHHQKDEVFVVAVENTCAPVPGPGLRHQVPTITDRHASWFLNGTLEEAIKERNIDELLNWVNSLGRSKTIEIFPGLFQLPFLVAEALLNHGFKLKGIVEFKVPE